MYFTCVPNGHYTLSVTAIPPSRGLKIEIVKDTKKEIRKKT